MTEEEHAFSIGDRILSEVGENSTLVKVTGVVCDLLDDRVCVRVTELRPWARRETKWISYYGTVYEVGALTWDRATHWRLSRE